MTENISSEQFSIEFNGKAFDEHEISASALAQSLLALDGLAQKIAETMYGKGVEAQIKVKAGFRRGSFIADLITYCTNNPKDAVFVSAAAVTVAGGVYASLKSVIRLGRFVFGGRANVKGKPDSNGRVTVINQAGSCKTFDISAVNVYNQGRTQIYLSRLTQTLDLEGSESIVFHSGSGDDDEVITKEDRNIFRYEEGVVLTDNEGEVILEVVGLILNGSGKGWRFSEGQGGLEFVADIEDEKFLQAVKDRKITFVYGSSIRAIMRTVQRKNIRTVTDRTIVEVKEVFPPE